MINQPVFSELFWQAAYNVPIFSPGLSYPSAVVFVTTSPTGSPLATTTSPTGSPTATPVDLGDGYTYMGCYKLEDDYGDEFDWDNRTYGNDMTPSVSSLPVIRLLASQPTYVP